MRKIILSVLAGATLLSGLLFYTAKTSTRGVLLFIVLALFVRALIDAFQTKHSLLRSYPLVARLRWLFESERAKIKQYFIESDLDGTPINREQRSVAYQRAKKQRDTIPFGTQHNVYQKGYAFVEHSIFPKEAEHVAGSKVLFGEEQCSQPYNGSILNISAMSFGSLSRNAVMALNQGAKMGGFAHNTGEGGISEHHLQGGDIIFQVGTGYFGAGVTRDGKRYFDEERFTANATRPEVKMIELKLSQGAKPGHGGILPAMKNTPEIAAIRGVNAGEAVNSPPYHTAFSDFSGMVDFLASLRMTSGGKPIGIKLCVGKKQEVENMIKIFAEKRSWPDYIAVDGGEGGTGAAPLEFTNYIGNPLIEGLLWVIHCLEKYDLKDRIKVIAGGKAVDAFDMMKFLALGADAVYMARGFMLSLGCIQARECNLDTCPVGVATQNEGLQKSLVVGQKNIRVSSFHGQTVHMLKEMAGAMGITDLKALDMSHILFRDDDDNIRSFKDRYESLYASERKAVLAN